MAQSIHDSQQSRATRTARRPARAPRCLLILLLAAYLEPAAAQFKLQQTFTNTTAPGWTLSGNALLTAPSIDPAGEGWLRLTGVATYESGHALDTSQAVPPNVPVTVRFNYVSWGGTGADGITVFLYDATQTMSGTQDGGGLGYCGGAGGYLAIGLDEYGNFSNPADRCGAAGGGPGRTPGSLVIRGPLSANNEYVTGATVTGGIDDPGAGSRPSPKTVIVTLTPATVGYTVSAEFQAASGQPFQVLFSNVAFPYAAPANLSVGFSGSTGGSTNNHELQGLITATPDDLQVTMSGPATVLEGTAVTYKLTVTNNGAYPIDAADAPTVLDTLPGSITNASWTCAAAHGATCLASGSGNIDSSALTLPSNGSVTYTITGTLDPAIACGGTVVNTASADFGGSSTFTDPDETNNTATVTSTVSCAVTLVANPSALTFGPQTVGVPSMTQSVTVTGTNGALISKIATSGDFSQTNNCSAALNGTSCTIEVTFSPTSEGSRSGTLSIVSSAASSPTLVQLSGTGTNAVPDPFSFITLHNVAPSSLQGSNAITVSGTNVPSTISISSGAEYSINGGPYTSTPGVISPGAEVTVRMTAAAAHDASETATLTIGGVAATFTVVTDPPPQLENVTVTSGGGGGLSALALGMLAVLVLLRLRRLRVAALAALLLAGAALESHPAAADDWQSGTSNLYFSGALGDVTSTLTAGKITSRLQADGYQVVASDLERGSLSGSLDLGYQLPRNFAVEFGWSYLGHTRAELQGIEPANLPQLLSDAARTTSGSGDAWTILARYRLDLRPSLSLDLRAGPYRWITHSALWFGAANEAQRDDRGWGYALGLGPRYVLSEHWAVGLNANYFASTTDNRFVQVTAGIEYRLR